jgi:hypothetical protein
VKIRGTFFGKSVFQGLHRLPFVVGGQVGMPLDVRNGRHVGYGNAS